MSFSIGQKITDNINKVIIGKQKAIELMLATLLAEGHLLLEDVPGVGKTVLANQGAVDSRRLAGHTTSPTVVDWNRDGLPDLVSISGGKLTVRLNLQPQTEIVKAFQNKYLITLTLGFLLTIGLMVYFIAKTLRPLRELTQRCSRISQGHLENVEIRKNAGEILALEHTFNGMVNALKEKELMEANLRQAQRLSALGSLAAGVAPERLAALLRFQGVLRAARQGDVPVDARAPARCHWPRR